MIGCISLRYSGIFKNFTDWHSHILPGVDDGVQTIGKSLDILGLYEETGVESVWLTPHVMEDIPNTTAHLRERFSELKEAYNGSVALHLAAEYMLDCLFEERLAAGDLLPLGTTGDRLLVETSCFNPPMGLHDILKRIKSKGYYPVLAHPERYVYMDMPEYERLREMGVLFQLNLLSLAGTYGSAARKKADRLLKGGFYTLAATDLHSPACLDSQVDIRLRRRLNKHITI